MSKNILVLGGSYFIGRRIVEDLLSAGFSVSTLNRGTKSYVECRVKQIHCDRNDENAVREALHGEKFDAVIDVSGLNRRQVSTVCSALGCVPMYVFISSSAVYDVDNCKAPFKETDKLGWNRFWTFYGTDKIEAENFLRETYAASGSSLVLLRPPYMYGENNYAYRESFVYDHILSGRPILLPGDGSAKIQFCYTGDLARLILCILATPKAGEQILNVGSRKPVSFLEWVALCEKVSGKTVEKVPFDYRAYGCSEREFFPFFDYDNVLDVSRSTAFGVSETPLEEGFLRAYQWYCENTEAIERKQKIIDKENEIYRALQLKQDV